MNFNQKQIFYKSFAMGKVQFKLKNEGSFLGILWYILEPIFMFTILITLKDMFKQEIEHYPLYLLLGLVIFNYFRKSTGFAIKAISSKQNQQLIKSIIIDNKIFVFSSFIESIFVHLFELLVVVGFMVYFGISISNMLYYPILFLFLAFFTLGITFILVSIGIYIKDLSNIWAIFTRLLWFATPIFYSSKIVLPFDFNTINPMYYFITIARQLIVYDTFPDISIITTTFAFSLISFLFGIYIFNKQNNKIAEII
jgi:ABC-type polysaccharide/polyol phosphate export permease